MTISLPAAATKPGLSLNLEFLLPLLFLLLLRLPYLLPAVPLYPVHDTNAYLQVFFHVYREFFLNSEIALWAPLNYYGTATTYDILYALTPLQYFAMLLGKGLQVSDSLWLFNFSVILEEMLFLTGVYLLARRLYRERLTIALVCLAAVGTSFWLIQLYWNFRLYSLVPFMLFFMLDFVQRGHARSLLLAGLFMLIALVGNVTYYAPLYLLLGTVFFVTLTGLHRKTFRWDRASFLRVDTLLVALLLAVVALAFFQLLAHSFDDTTLQVANRNPDKTVPLDVFLTYGTLFPNNFSSFFQLLYPMSYDPDWMLYLGPTVMLFVLYGLWRHPRHPVLVALAVTTLVMLLASIPASGFPTLLYHTWPGMKFYRHVEHMRPLVKCLLLFLFGFGVDALLQGYRTRGLFWLAVLVGGGAVVGEFLIKEEKWLFFAFRDQQQYARFSTHAIVGVGVMGLALLVMHPAIRQRARWAPAALLLLLAINFLDYQLTLHSLQPVVLTEKGVGILEKRTTRMQTIQMARKDFHVQPYDFPAKRVFEAEKRLAEFAPLLMHSPGSLYHRVYTTGNVDPCVPDARLDYLPTGVDRLWRTRLGLPVTGTLTVLDARKQKAAARDITLLHAVGCNAPKLSLMDQSGVRVVQDWRTAQEMIRQEQPGGVRPVIIDPNPPPVLEKKGDKSGHGRILRYTANTVVAEVQVEDPGGGWLVYLDAAHPGWQAWVDDQPQAVRLTNLAFKAVHVPVGLHYVVYHFVGTGQPGLYIALLFGLSVAGVLYWLGGMGWLLAHRQSD